jgi:putative endonuclease
MSFFVYILASRRNGTFTKKYGIKTLVWYELHESRESAFQRERQLKKWNRAWKLALIERSNPIWQDRASELV